MTESGTSPPSIASAACLASSRSRSSPLSTLSIGSRSIAVASVHLEKVREHRSAAGSQYRFRVELHALNAQGLVAESHDKPIRGPARHLQAAGNAVGSDHERVVTSRLQRAVDPTEHGPAVVVHARRRAVHRPRTSRDPRAHDIADDLVAQADTQDGNLAGELPDRVAGYPRVLGSPRPRGDDQVRRRERPDTWHIDIVVARHDHLGPQYLESLGEVVGERIVVVDERHLAAVHHRSPLSAERTARTTARALDIVSSYSVAGSESATTPAPACTCARPSRMTTVLMAMQVSMSPEWLM